MARGRGPREVTAERWRSSLWQWPTAAGGVALVGALLLSRHRPAAGSRWASLWPGDVDAATALLQVMATSVMTATTLTFSLTVVALQLASQQFSPRLLREFGRDPVTKRVLAVLSSTFVFSTATLHGLRADEAVPALAVAVAFALGIGSLAAILAFITHMVRAIRVDTMMLVVHDETARAIATFYPSHDDRDGAGLGAVAHPGSDASLVTATASGFVQSTDVAALVEAASAVDGLARVEVRAGDHLVRGAPLAHVWGRGRPLTEAEADELAHGVRHAVRLGYERTVDQDAGFGFRQLEDVAVKAMSPSVNDPVTAAHAVGHLADLLVRLTRCRLGPTLHRDAEGIGRAVVPDRDLRYYLDLACGQLRRFAAGEPSVLVALLRMLRDVAAACRDDGQRAEVRRAAGLVADQAAPDLLPVDREAIDDLVARVELALDGAVVAAYADRAGETRSI